MYTKWSYERELDETTAPEIQRTNLTAVVLLLKSIGINDLLGFDFLDAPPAECLIRALEHVYALGALNADAQLTKLGRKMAELPVAPTTAKLFCILKKWAWWKKSCLFLRCLTLVVLLYSTSKRKDKAKHATAARKKFYLGVGGHGDHLVLLNVYNQWSRDAGYSSSFAFENYLGLRVLRRARDIREQLQGLLERVEVENCSRPNDHLAIRKSILAGFFYNTARITKDTTAYKHAKSSMELHIHPSSSLFKAEHAPSFVCFNQIQHTSKEYMREVIEIDPSWLLEIAPHYYTERDVAANKVKKKKMPIVNSRNSRK